MITAMARPRQTRRTHSRAVVSSARSSSGSGSTLWMIALSRNWLFPNPGKAVFLDQEKGPESAGNIALRRSNRVTRKAAAFVGVETKLDMVESAKNLGHPGWRKNPFAAG